MAHIQIHFSAHMECYKEVIEQFKEAHPHDTLDFSIAFASEPYDMMCSEKCKEIYDLKEQLAEPTIKKGERNNVVQ